MEPAGVGTALHKIRRVFAHPRVESCVSAWTSAHLLADALGCLRTCGVPRVPCVQSRGFVHMKDELETPHKLRLLSFSQENWSWNVKRENCRETMEIVGYLNATLGMNSSCLHRDAGIKQGKLLWKTQKTLWLWATRAQAFNCWNPECCHSTTGRVLCFSWFLDFCIRDVLCVRNPQPLLVLVLLFPCNSW